MMMNVKIKVKEEPSTQMQGESPVDEEEEEEENEHLPISLLFQKRRTQLQSLHSSSLLMPMEVHDSPQKAARCKRKRPRDKNYNDHVAMALPAFKSKAEEAWANPSVMERAKEVQAYLSDEFPSFLKVMIPSIVCRGFWMSLPKEFCQLILPSHDTTPTVTLVDDSGKEYRINFLVQRRALSGGWKKFSREHGLLVGDVLIFHLIEPSKFKVYIVRVNGLAEVDAALGLLRLGSSAKLTGIRKNTSEPFSSDINQNEVHKNSLCYLKAEENQPENGRLDIGSSEMEGIRSWPEVNAEFKQLRDAIRASKISTPGADFVAWDNTVSGFELLGMDVGSLPNRMHQLPGLSFESKSKARSRRYKEAILERAYAEEEARSLELELVEKKKEIRRLDAEIEALNVNARRYKLMFEAAANAPW